MGHEENITSQVPRDETTPHLHCDFVPLDCGESIRAKTRIGDKENATQEKFLEVM